MTLSYSLCQEKWSENVMWIKIKFDLNSIVLYIYDNLKKAYE